WLEGDGAGVSWLHPVAGARTPGGVPGNPAGGPGGAQGAGGQRLPSATGGTTVRDLRAGGGAAGAAERRARAAEAASKSRNQGAVNDAGMPVTDESGAMVTKKADTTMQNDVDRSVTP